MPQIDENGVQVVGADDDTPIQYFVSSCLTVTCGFSDGTRIGAHFSHGESGRKWTYTDSVATWNAFTAAVTNKLKTVKTSWVVAQGQIDMWKPSYLTTARLATDYATSGDLTSTIKTATGVAPAIATQTGGFVVLTDGAVV